MREFREDILSAKYNEQYVDVELLERLAYVARHIPLIVSPIKGSLKDPGAIFDGILDNSFTCLDADRASECLNSMGMMLERPPVLYVKGFYLIPTVEKTTLFYEARSDCFIKIIHPVKMKDKVRSFFSDRAEDVCRIADRLKMAGLVTPQIVSYGRLNGMRHFYFMKRIDGVSLNHLCLHRKEVLTFDFIKRVLDVLARFHASRLWHGDLRLSHLFICKDKDMAIIDIDSIRQNLLLRRRNMAKDLAGINHPALPFDNEERIELLNHYAREAGIEKIKEFMDIVRYYSERRWGVKIEEDGKW